MTSSASSAPLAPEQDDRADRAGRDWLRTSEVEALAVIGGVGLLGFLLLDNVLLYLMTTSIIYVLFALSTNVLFGWTGMASFGQAAYFGVGAYTVGLLRDAQLSPLLLVLLAGVLGAVMAGMLGVLAVRVSGVQFAMLTLVFAQVLYIAALRVPALGGEDGLPGITRGSVFGIDIGGQGRFWWFVIVVVGLGAYGLLRIRRSSLGVSMAAVRDDPLRAAALGIPVRLVRILAFVVAGGFGATAGSLFAMQQGLTSPSVLYWVLSGNVIIMCLVGGLHHFWGPAVGAVVFTILNWYLFSRVSGPLFYVGLVLLVVVVFLPGGLASTVGLVRERFARSEAAR